MSEKSQNQKNKEFLIKQAENDLLSGKISRREFSSLMVWLGVVSGFNFLGPEKAKAWVGTRMRKGNATAASGGINYSIRFTGASNSYLTRTAVAPTNNKKFTISCWVKFTNLVYNNSISYSPIWASGTASTDRVYFGMYKYNDSLLNKLHFCQFNGGSGADFQKYTNGFYRDPASWYHLVVSYDSTNTTPALRQRFYVNGKEVTYYGSGAYNLDAALNTVANNQISTNGMWLGRNENSSLLFEFNLAQFAYVDGTQLTPSYFAETDVVSGEWIPKTPTGFSWGNNGCYLTFSDNSSTGTTGLGKDSSGQGNHWSAGAAVQTYDQLLDNPTNNFCTLNPVGMTYGNGNLGTFSSGALSYASAGNSSHCFSTFGINDSNGYYFEAICTSIDSARTYIGIIEPNAGSVLSNGASYSYVNKCILSCTGDYMNTGSGTAGGTAGSFTSYTTSDVIQVAYKNGKIWFGKNGTWMNSGDPAAGTGAVDTSVSTSVSWLPYVGYNSSFTVNFGQGGQTGLTYDSASGGRFKYTPPSGFKALSTDNLSTPAVTNSRNYFSAIPYTGNGGTQTVGGFSERASAFTCAGSLRFSKANLSNLTNTFSTAGDRRTWTMSFWMKRGQTADHDIMGIYNASDDNNNLEFRFNSSGKLQLILWSTSVFETTQTFTDTSSWYHVVLRVDTTQVLSTDRFKLYINGTEVTSFSTDNRSSVSQNQQLAWGLGSVEHNLNRWYAPCASGYYGDIYLTEINFIDGQSLHASNFGLTDTGSNEWVPTSYLGTYGANGFYLTFSDDSNNTAATLGADSAPISGAHSAANNWTPNNLNTYDRVIDSPMKNFCVMNQSYGVYYPATFSSAGLAATYSASSWSAVVETTAFSTGKYYWEVTPSIDASSGVVFVGVMDINSSITSSTPTISMNKTLAFATAGYTRTDLGDTAGYSTVTTQTIGVAVDCSAQTVSFYKANVLIVTLPFSDSSLAGKTLWPIIMLTGQAGTMTVTVNFGQGGVSGLTYDSASGGSFKYTPPSGYKALNSVNLATTSTTAGVEPGLVWIKSRSATTDHALYDIARGVQKDHASNLTAVQTTQTTGLQSFNSKGFTIGSLAKLNTSGATYVSWLWKNGGTATTNNDGAVTSTVYINSSMKFSIVSYSGTGANTTTGHGLGTTPDLIIWKSLEDIYNWDIFFKSLGYTSTLTFTTAATRSVLHAAPNATTIPVTNLYSGGSTTGKPMIAYCFAESTGFSKFGSYTGNGSADGPFIWCGFRPAFIAIKRTETTGGWYTYDAARDTFNGVQNEMDFDSTLAETSAGGVTVDFVSNGFKLKRTGGAVNILGGYYAFIAFAEAPFKYATAR